MYFPLKDTFPIPQKTRFFTKPQNYLFWMTGIPQIPCTLAFWRGYYPVFHFPIVDAIQPLSHRYFFILLHSPLYGSLNFPPFLTRHLHTWVGGKKVKNIMKKTFPRSPVFYRLDNKSRWIEVVSGFVSKGRGEKTGSSFCGTFPSPDLYFSLLGFHSLPLSKKIKYCSQKNIFFREVTQPQFPDWSVFIE